MSEDTKQHVATAVSVTLVLLALIGGIVAYNIAGLVYQQCECKEVAQ